MPRNRSFRLRCRAEPECLNLRAGVSWEVKSWTCWHKRIGSRTRISHHRGTARADARNPSNTGVWKHSLSRSDAGEGVLLNTCVGCGCQPAIGPLCLCGDLDEKSRLTLRNAKRPVAAALRGPLLSFESDCLRRSLSLHHGMPLVTRRPSLAMAPPAAGCSIRAVIDLAAARGQCVAEIAAVEASGDGEAAGAGSLAAAQTGGGWWGRRGDRGITILRRRGRNASSSLPLRLSINANGKQETENREAKTGQCLWKKAGFPFSVSGFLFVILRATAGRGDNRQSPLGKG